jgi:transcription factor TFIIIB component B''
MSLRIKKGSKVWGPKPPVARRPGAPSSAQSSARPSVERQSQTPAPVSTRAEISPVPEDEQEITEPIPVIEPPLATQSHVGIRREPSAIAIVTEVGGINDLKRKQSMEEDLAISVSPKRVRVGEPASPPRSPSQPSGMLVKPVKPSPPNGEETTALGRNSPVSETRQDIESSVYPDPELSSGLGPAGGTPSATTGIREGAGLGPAGSGNSNAAQIAQAPQIVSTTILDFEPSGAEVLQETVAGATKKKKGARRRKLQPNADEDDDIRATLEMQLNAPRRVTSSKRNQKKKDKDGMGNKRGMTPEGAEDEQINPSTMKMAELCRDIRIGVKSSNHDMIKQRMMEKKAKAKLAKTNPELVPLIEGTEHEDQNPAADELVDSTPAPSGPRMRIVNGQIVLAENSLRLDRHKRAEAENEVMVEVEENEFSHMTTSGTFMKRERAQLWDARANAIFYQGLAQFGTDFETIAKLFPTRNRRQIKLKFNSEERKNPARLNRILMGKPEKIDLEEFEEMSGLKLEDVAVIERERVEIAEEHEREVLAREKEKTDADLKKKKEIADRSATARKVLESADDEPEEGSSGKENRNDAPSENMAEVVEQTTISKGKGNRKAQPKPRKKKNPHGRGTGGDVVEVLGTVE